MKYVTFLMMISFLACTDAFGAEPPVWCYLPKAIHEIVESNDSLYTEWLGLVEQRDWDDSSGKHSTNAALSAVSLDGERVRLALHGGKHAVVHVSHLSSEARDRVESVRKLLPWALSVTVKGLHDTNEELAKEVAQGARKLDKVESQLRTSRMNIDRLTSAYNSAIEEQKQMEVDHQRKIDVLVGKPVSGKAGSENVTSRALEVAGHKYVGKKVQLRNVTFSGVSNTWNNLLRPGVVEINGREVSVYPKPLERWIGFQFNDANGDLWQRAFALEEDYGDLLLALERDEKVSVAGTVVLTTHTGWYALIVSGIERHR